MIENSPLIEKKPKPKNPKGYKKENVPNLYEEIFLNFFSLNKTEECECISRDCRETLILSVFCSNIFIWSFHDEKTDLNTFNYVACEKIFTETFVATQSPSKSKSNCQKNYLPWEHAEAWLVPPVFLKDDTEEMIGERLDWSTASLLWFAEPACKGRWMKEEGKIKVP